MKYAYAFLFGAIAAAGLATAHWVTAPVVFWIAVGLYLALNLALLRRRPPRVHRRRPGLPRPRRLVARTEPRELGRNRHQHPPRPNPIERDVESALRNFGAAAADARKAAAGVPAGIPFDQAFRMALTAIPGRKAAR